MMKRAYSTPSIEKVEFRYSDQIVAASGCGTVYINNSWDQASGGCCNQIPYEVTN